MRYASTEFPGCGGRIKDRPSDFVVTELPLYEPADEGPHVYVCFTREGRTTRSLVTDFARLLQVRDDEVGCAGNKDKVAVATQTFSVHLPSADPEEIAARVADELDVEVHWARRHRNKLRTGHLLGNAFSILVREVTPDAELRATAVLERLSRTGLPNYYGQQRQGANDDNADKGRRLLVEGGRRKRWLSRLLLSAWQSAGFNEVLDQRIDAGWMGRLLPGDIAKKVGTGGLFEIEDATVEQPRLDAQEITWTGPMFGSKMRWPTGEIEALERAVLEEEGVTAAMLKRAKLPGTRRAGLVHPTDAEAKAVPEGLRLTFSLPKGSYATVLLSEITK